MRVLFLTSGPRSRASARYRALQFLPCLEGMGFEIRVRAPVAKPKSALARFITRKAEERCILEDAEWADTVFIQKRLFHRGLVNKIRSATSNLIFDFDDAITISHNNQWSIVTEWKARLRFEAICSTADLVVAGNNYLAVQARKYALRVEVLPTVVDPSRYKEKLHINTDDVVIGWIGQPANYGYLEYLAPTLRDLCMKYPGVSLRVVSRGKANLPGVRVEYVSWDEGTEVDDLLGMDIGLMPLPSDNWSKGKCALKAIQYMASGIPVVCSDVGANPEVVRQGIDGILVSNDRSSWGGALEKLILSRDMRAEMGLSGRRRVNQYYSLECAGRLLYRWLGGKCEQQEISNENYKQAGFA